MGKKQNKKRSKKQRRSAAKMSCKKDNSRSKLTGGVSLIIPFLMSAVVLLWYGIFKAGMLGLYSSTAYSIFIGVIVAFGLLFGILRIPSPVIGWILPLLMVIAFRFPPIDCALYICGWLITWNGISRPELGQNLFLGATFLCYFGLVAILAIGNDWPFGNLNYFALTAGVVWSVYLGKWLTDNESSVAYHLLGMTAVLLALIFIKHRGQTIFVLVIMCVLAVFFKIKKPWNTIAAGTGVFIIGTAAWSGMLTEVLFKFGKADSFHGRLLYWGMAWNGFVTEPVLGKGVWGYSIAQFADPLFRIVVLCARMNEELANAHNIFMQLLVCSGAIGILTLFFTTGWLFWQAIRNQKEKSLPFIFAVLAFLIAGATSKPPFSTPGLVIWGAVWSALAGSVAKTLKNDDHNVHLSAFNAFFIRDIPKGLSEKLARYTVLSGVLLFAVAQPLNHERVLRKPYLALKQPFWQIFYAPRVFFPSAADIGKILYDHKKYNLLYEFEKSNNAHVPRKIGWMRVAYAASLARRPHEEVCEAAIKQFLWYPFEIREKNRKAHREIMLKGGVSILEHQLTALHRPEARAIACFAGLRVPEAASVRKLLANDKELSIMELAWAFHGALYLKNTDKSLLQAVFKRCLKDMGRDASFKYFLARYFQNYK